MSKFQVLFNFITVASISYFFLKFPPLPLTQKKKVTKRQKNKKFETNDNKNANENFYRV